MSDEVIVEVRVQPAVEIGMNCSWIVRQHVDLLLAGKRRWQMAFDHKKVVDKRVALIERILAVRLIVVAYSGAMDKVEPVPAGGKID